MTDKHLLFILIHSSVSLSNLTVLGHCLLPLDSGLYLCIGHGHVLRYLGWEGAVLLVIQFHYVR